MEQRPLRLGDIVDDYCPRERRLTNHAIVAVVDNTIRQTRCTTCDAEHVYKHGREPRRRTKAGETLYDQVLADLTGGQLVAPKAADAEGAEAAAAPAAPETTPAVVVAAKSVVPAAAATLTPSPSTDAPPQSEADARADAWLAHRRLIRAALPRTEGEPPVPRAIPEFTMHQRPQGRGGRPFRFGGSGGGNGAGGERNGNVAHPRDHRSHQNGAGNGSGGSWPEGQGQPGRPGGGGRRRHRRKRPRP